MDEAKNHIEMGDFSENLKTVQNAQKRTKIPKRSFFGRTLQPVKKNVNTSIINVAYTRQQIKLKDLKPIHKRISPPGIHNS